MQDTAMTTNGNSATREERLAAKLRENLRRRKSQARAQVAEPKPEQSEPDPLPNSPPKS
jgi:tRNA A37 threonylcarbamoyladenosine dehydratase